MRQRIRFLFKDIFMTLLCALSAQFPDLHGLVTE
jgi:hypothetical protein